MAGGITRAWLRGVVWLNVHLKSAAMRLTRITGKSRVPIHPKHLLNIDLGQYWYLHYVEPGMRVLDLGCGNGMHGIRVAGRAAMVVGVDRDLRHLQTGRRLGAEHGVAAISFLLGDVEQPLPFGANRFDLVLLLDVIEHLEGRIELLREVHRVLRPEGTLLISAPNRGTSWKRRLQMAGLPYHTDPDHKVEYSREELEAELEEGGFRVEGEFMPIVYDTPWAGLIDFVGGLSLSAYRHLSRWKRESAQHHPQESIGWRLQCRSVSADRELQCQRPDGIASD